MRNHIVRKLGLGLVVVTAVLTWGRVWATEGQAAGGRAHGTELRLAQQAGTEEGKAKRTTRYPIRGKLKAVDVTGQTFTLKGTERDRVFKVDTDTVVLKGGKEATLADAVVGEEVGGMVERHEDGTVVALKVRFGPKPEGADTGTTRKTTGTGKAPTTG